MLNLSSLKEASKSCWYWIKASLKPGKPLLTYLDSLQSDNLQRLWPKPNRGIVGGLDKSLKGVNDFNRVSVQALVIRIRFKGTLYIIMLKLN